MSNLVLIPEIVVDEVALEGLDGLTIETLWVRLADRLKWPQPLNPKIKEAIWSFIVRQEQCFRCFRLPSPRPSIRTFDRADFLAGEIVKECPFTTYESNFIEMDGLRGSCQDFGSRELVLRDALLGLTLEEVVKEFGETLVIVGSQDIREAVLIPKSIPRNISLTLQQYCLLERIGRSRYNGEVSFGKFSFLESTLYHIRKNLFKYKLLVKQTYMEKFSEATSQGLLLHLPRFFRLYKPKQMLMIEHIVGVIQLNPNCLMEYTTAGAMFEDAHRIALRKLYKQNMFTQLFETDIKVPYRQVYPDAPPSQYNHRKKDEERVLRVFRLRDPNLDVRTMWTHDVDDDNSDSEGLLDQTNVRLDISLKEQVYRLVEKSKQEGLSQKQVATKLGLTKLTSRGIIRVLERQGMFHKFMKDSGRQRSSTYILKKYKESLDKTFNAELNIPISIEETLQVETTLDTKPTSTLDTKIDTDDADISAADLEAAFGPVEPCDPKPEICPSAPLNMHLNNISVEIKNLTDFSKGKFARHRPLMDKAITMRMAKRMKYVEQTVRTCRVIEDFSKLYTGLLKEEMRMGYTDMLCRRTLYRMLARMSKDRKLRLLEVVFRNKGARTQLILICHPDIEDSDELVLAMIEKEKLKFLMRLNNEQLRLKRKTTGPDDGPLTKKTTEETATEKKAVEEKVAEETAGQKPTKLITPIIAKKRKPFVIEIRYGSTPKFHKIRTIHEFYFYIVYDYPVSHVIPPHEAIEQWKLQEPRIDYEELLNELPPIYSAEIGWKMFVPPIVRYPPYTEDGWLLLSDAILRMPLSVYCSISNMLFEIPGLDEVLSHPIRKHYPLCSLPPALQKELMLNRKHVIHVTDCSRRAASLGLVQFGPQRRKDREQVFIFLNRHASQLNTVMSAPGYYQTSIQDYPKIVYTFNTTEDIASYWSNLHSICINTRLGKRMTTDYVTIRWDSQPRMIALWHNHTRDFVIDNDTGDQPGDGRGAGGVDSSMFAHLLRNWSFQRSSTLRKPRPPPKPASVPIKLVQKPNLTRPVNAPHRIVAPIKRVMRKSQQVTVKPNQKRPKQQHYDEIDRQALRKMVKLRVDWNQEEDNLLLLCRVAMQMLCPTTRKLTVSSQQIRDILHWSLKSFDKTSRACQRRIVYMMKRESVARKVHLLVQEVEQNSFFQNRFGETFYPKLCKQIPDEDDCQHALRTCYVELVFLLKTHYHSPDGTMINSRAPVLPDTLAEFNQTFCAKYESYSHDRLKYSTPTSPRDVEVNVMTSIIHSSCCCVRDKTSYNIQLYEIYKNYPDRTLSLAMSKVRDDHLISANKLSSKVLSTRSLPLSSSPYHLSVTYSFSMLTSIPVRLIDAAYESYVDISASAVHGGMQLRTIDGGCFMILGELLHHNPLTQIDIGIPNPVLVFDSSKCPENKVLLERINNRFRSIFEYVQNDNKQKLHAANVAPPRPTTHADESTSAASRKSRRVTISTGEHRTHGFYVSPVERLMKMDDCMFHFYCVLDAIGQRTTMSALRIDADKRCTFDCVLGKANPVGAAIDIIRQRAELLPLISEDEQTDTEQQVTEFEIDIWNVLIVFNALVTNGLHLEEDEPEEVTDHGMPQLSLEILRDDQDPMAMNVDMGEDDTVVVEEETEPKLEAIIHQEEEEEGEEADGDVDDMVHGGGKGGDKIYKMHDYFFLNPCRLSMRLTSNREMLQSDPVERDAFLEDISSGCVWNTEYGKESDIWQRLDKESLINSQKESCVKVLEFLARKMELGATNIELVAEFPDRESLLKTIQLLQNCCMVLQTGVVEVTFVHCLFVTPWLVGTYNMKRLQRETVVPVPFQLIKVADWAAASPSAANDRKRRHSPMEDDCEEGESSTGQEVAEVDVKPLRPNRLTRVTIHKNSKLPAESQLASRSNFQMLIKPWLRINGSLNRRVLDRWLSVILVYCVSNPESTIERLAKRFNLLIPVHIRELAEYMERLDLVSLKAMLGTGAPLNIWSKYEPPKIVHATNLDSIESVFVEVRPHAITRLGLFIGEKQYKTEFV